MDNVITGDAPAALLAQIALAIQAVEGVPAEGTGRSVAPTKAVVNFATRKIEIWYNKEEYS